MEILYNYYYDHSTSNENDYSVCVLFRHGEKSFLFTGDLEEKGEERLVENNTLPEVELFKAGHHGSYTANTDKLLSVVKPKICVVCCCAGNAEYTSAQANQFPSQTFVNNISKYTDKVYVVSIGDTDYTEGGAKFSDLNGNVVVASDADKVTVNCSKNNTVLKETAWFKAKRTMPPSWAS